MTAFVALELSAFLLLVLALSVPLGLYMARVYEGRAGSMQRLLGPLERSLYRWTGVRSDEEMNWTRYAIAVLSFSAWGIALLVVLQRCQSWLPLNPDGLGPVPWLLAFNTAVSFVTNTNWQGYGGETTLSYGSQLIGLTVQNFVSAATGMAVLVALLRGFTRRTTHQLGSFWVDLTRSVVYILLPLSLVVALALVSQGVVQTLRPHAVVDLVDAASDAEGSTVTEQVLAMGPVASQIAIKQLGTNGGGFFNVNSAHPFENPTPLSNLIELMSILLIPTGFCITFGALVRDPRQGWALLSAMFLILLPLLALCVDSELAGNPALTALGAEQSVLPTQSGGNMEGKEVRFGPLSSALWGVATTATSNGSVNSMHDSFMPLGGLVLMWLMQLGEVVFGGVGSGLYGMLVFAIVSVFIAGLMVGRTPEYLGKKVGAFELKMSMLAVLLPAAAVLLGTAVASVTESGVASRNNPGAHGFSEILYAFSSASNNNGSAFAGLNAATPFYAVGLAICMLVGRFGAIVPILAIAGSLAAKQAVPSSAGTMPTHTPLFVLLLVGTVLLIGALSFIPALALGPIVEHLGLSLR